MRRRLPSKSMAHWSRLQVARTASRCRPTMPGGLGGRGGAASGRPERRRPGGGWEASYESMLVIFNGNWAPMARSGPPQASGAQHGRCGPARGGRGDGGGHRHPRSHLNRCGIKQARPGSIAAMEPQLREAEASEELGFFFKRLGELCVSPAASQAYAGPASSLAVAARAGAVFFSDAQGAWCCCSMCRSCCDWHPGSCALAGRSQTQAPCCRCLPPPALPCRSVRLPHGRSAAPPAKMEQRRVSGRPARRRCRQQPLPLLVSAITCVSALGVPVSAAHIHLLCSLTLRRQLPPTPAAEVAAAVLPLPGAALLSLSPDEALLAAAAGSTVHIYSTQQLLAGSTAKLAQQLLPGEVLRLAWRPGSTAGEFAALVADGSTHLGSVTGSSTAPLAAAAGLPAACLAWSPDGAQLAVGAGDEVALYVAEGDSWRQAAALRALSGEVQDDDQQLEVRKLMDCSMRG